MYPDQDRRRGEPCPHLVRPVQKHFHSPTCRRGKKAHVQMGEIQTVRLEKILLAERLWRIFRKPISFEAGIGLYCQPKATPPKNNVSGGVSSSSQQISGILRRTVRVGLNSRPPFQGFSGGGLLFPRALPWAEVAGPFRAEDGLLSFPGRCLGLLTINIFKKLRIVSKAPSLSDFATMACCLSQLGHVSTLWLWLCRAGLR